MGLYRPVYSHMQGSKKVLSGRTGQVDFLAGKVTFKAHLHNMQGSSKLSSNKIMYYKDDHEVAPAKQNVITAWLKAMLKFTFFEP